MIVYGRNPLREALRGRRASSVGDIWATSSAAAEPWLKGHELQICAAEEISRRCGSTAHQGVCAEAGLYPYVEASVMLDSEAPLIVVLDQVQDPQNLGSICRTAECVGASGLVIGERRSAEVTPTVCKASAGAVEHLRLARARNVANFLIEARRSGCWSYGASLPPTPRQSPALDRSPVSGRSPTLGRSAAPGRSAALGRPTASGQSSARDRAQTAVPYTEVDYRGGVLLVLGSEGHGLRARVAAECDQLIFLPLRGRVESLGVAAAASALLYGILQARRT